MFCCSIEGLIEYDGDGGRTKKITTGANAQTIKYVGSLFEDAGTKSTKHIFLGGMEVASISNGQLIYYHADHLGGTNVTTNATGVKKELCEYLPFGGFSRHEKYGTSDEVSWFYFTGKKLDEDTGLYYYGARYYDPSLGRFITPDTIVPYPTDPQSFNRYSYCHNNPINRTDPSGHKSFWKKLWGGVKDAVRDFGGLFGVSGNVLNGIINNDWNPLKNQVVAASTAFVFSGFNPIVATAAFVTTSFLDSLPGRQVTKFVGTAIFDNAFGMRPGTAQVWARVGLQIAGTLAVDRLINGVPVDPSRDLASRLSNSKPSGIGWDDTSALYSNGTGRDFFDKVGGGGGIGGGIGGGRAGLGANLNIKVIGRLPDTKVAIGWKGYDVLNVKNWTEAINDAWVEEGIINAQTFYVASPITPGNIYGPQFGKELFQILKAGYTTQDGFHYNMLVP